MARPVAKRALNCALATSGCGCSNDGQEILCIKARAAHQGTVYVRLAQKRGGVVRLYAAAVLNRKRTGPNLAELFSNSSTKEGMGLLSLFRSGISSSPDGPHGLIGHHQPA